MKLNKTLATQVDEASTGSYEPLPEGIYTVRLREVTIKEGTKAPYWSWEFEVCEGEFTSRRLWANTSLSEAALWKLKETFDAFGVGTDTDTEELLGKKVRALVVQRTIQQGARAGEVTNQIDQLKVLDADGSSPTPSVTNSTEFAF